MNAWGMFAELGKALFKFCGKLIELIAVLIMAAAMVAMLVLFVWAISGGGRVGVVVAVPNNTCLQEAPERHSIKIGDTEIYWETRPQPPCRP